MWLCPLQVFKKAYIPRTLKEVSHYERDVDAMRAEEESAISGHAHSVRHAPWCSSSGRTDEDEVVMKVSVLSRSCTRP